MNTTITTYVSGFELSYNGNQPFTTTHLMKLCNDLTVDFNVEFKTDSFHLVPEAITEGGIWFKSFPGKTNEAYKTMRIYFPNDYPWVSNDKFKTEEVLIPVSNKALRTVLKAFYEAPAWTLEELRLMEKTLKTYGFKCSKFPAKKDLTC